MNEKGKKVVKWITDNIIDIIKSLFSIITALISFFRGKELGWTAFWVMLLILKIILLINVVTICRKIFKEFKKFRAYRRKIKNEVRQYGKTSKYDYAYCKEESREHFLGKCLAIVVKQLVIMIFSVMAIAFICQCSPQNSQTYWNKITEFMSNEENHPVESTVVKVDDEPKAVEETMKEIRNTTWRFILKQPERSFRLDPDLEKQAFFVIDKSDTEFEKYVKETVSQWKGTKKGVDYKTIKDNEGNDFFTYTKQEDEFKGEVEEALQQIYYDEWLKKAPFSSRYDACIEGREKLNAIEVNGEKGCYEIWWKLANDYQYYAQEYENQTTNAEAILYYYAKSIYCCMEALKYTICEEEYNDTFHYMVMRYHDIFRGESIISQKYKDKANNVFIILVELDTKWSTAE